ncbi:bifunctional glycosyltransferase family 2 protein/class I SAM-dependent methyltransferase [Paenibacillaceae sp. P-4]|uniref:glycosyltransferase n=1 Tax=Paenibacillaceae bacterium P-4 TaxID=3160969 RepID=UPI0032E83042
MLTSIVILTHNKLDYTIQCIESIRRYTRPNSYEIIVVDNQSTDETVPWLSAQSDIRAIFNEQNEGFPKGCNQGIEISNGDHILLLNNDVIVTENWLENMMTCITSDESIGAVSCITNHCSYGQMIPVPYNTVESMYLFAEEHNCSNRNEWEERLKLVGFCMLIRKSVVDKIGLLDERFTPGNYEDDDYSIRIRKAGYKLILCKDTFIHHYGSTSFRENNDSFVKLLQTNVKKYENKWGFNPDYSQHIRTEIVNLIDSPLDAKLNVLEVGCACGGTLLKIKNVYKNSTLYGIELNEKAAEVASLIAEVSASNIETEQLPYPESHFDYVIFADVLEHLYDPWKVLINIKQYLKPNGKVLISLPNIMHQSVIRPLLHGYWTYQDAGILDRTHVRFFTLHEINKMLLETGYANINIQGKTLPGTVEEQKFMDNLSKVLPQHVMQQFEVYQYIASVQNNEPLKKTIRYIREHITETAEIVQQLNSYSPLEIIHNVNEEASEQKVNILNAIAVSYFEQEMYQKVLPFLEEALASDESNIETLYNSSYVLYFIGETELGKKYAQKLKAVDEAAYEDLEKVISDFLIEM